MRQACARAPPLCVYVINFRPALAVPDTVYDRDHEVFTVLHSSQGLSLTNSKVRLIYLALQPIVSVLFVCVDVYSHV